MGFKHQRMLLAVCKEYDVSQIAFPLHIVIVSIISLFLESCWGFQCSFFHLWILVYSTALEDYLVKSQVGYLCVLKMDISILFRYFNLKLFNLNILRRAEG